MIIIRLIITTITIIIIMIMILMRLIIILITDNNLVRSSSRPKHDPGIVPSLAGSLVRWLASSRGNGGS